MYDASREAKEFVAERREDAVAKACQFFGLEEDGLSISGRGSKFLFRFRFSSGCGLASAVLFDIGFSAKERFHVVGGTFVDCFKSFDRWPPSFHRGIHVTSVMMEHHRQKVRVGRRHQTRCGFFVECFKHLIDCVQGSHECQSGGSVPRR